MAHLALALLGPFQATLDGQPVEGLNSDRLRALLAYLAVERGREHAREQVAALLWPERPDREALSALRYALSNLHGALEDRQAPSPFLLSTRTTIQFNADSDHWLDVAEFESLSGRPAVPHLERALGLYRGRFLDGLSVGDSPAFDEWVLLKGEEYRRSVLSVLGRLATLQTARGNYGAAAGWARRQLELEPYREQAHRQLMVALALGGERSAALAQYEACRRLLAEELGCEPEDETQALYAQIRDGAAIRRPLREPAQAVAAQATPTARAARETVGQAQGGARFVAREGELDRLGSLLERALVGEGGVALIVGEAGSGKTALLEELARRASQAYADLIVLRGSCNAHAGAGDPYLPFREMVQTLAADVEGKRAGGTLSPEQARRVWEAQPVVGEALVEHGPDLLDRFVPGEALLRRAEGFSGPSEAGRWQTRLREMVWQAGEGVAAAPTSGLTVPGEQVDLFGQVTQVLHAVSLRRPLLLAIDDLQWADGGTAALLFHLGRRLAGSRILLVCAYRPEAMEELPDFGSLGSVLRELTREWGDVLVDLDKADGRAFVEAYVDSEPNCLGTAFRQALYDHTSGNPLFTVELLRSFERQGSLVQDGAGRWVEAAGPDWERWPAKVEAVIAGHLAGLPEEGRVLLQAASAQGERFAAEVVARVLGRSEETVVRQLSGPLSRRQRLVEVDSLDRLATSGQRLSRYRFRHWLVQRMAYSSLDTVARAWLHEATGRALEAIASVEGEQAAPETWRQALAPELARQFEAAGLPLEAAGYRLEAGRWTVRLAAYEEAIAHLERGRALLEGVPTSRERLGLELGLELAMVNPAVVQQGFQAPNLTRALERLFALSQHPDLQDDPRRVTTLVVLAHASTWSANPLRGRKIGEQLLDLARSEDPLTSLGTSSGQALAEGSEGDRQSLMLAHWVLGHSQWLRGELVAARAHLEWALACSDPQAGQPLRPLLGGDPQVMGRAVLGFVQWLLGYPDQARDNLRQAEARGEEMEQPSSAAFAHVMAGVAHLVLGRDVAAAQRHATALRLLGRAGLVYGPWAELLEGQARTAGPEPGIVQDLAQPAEAGFASWATGSGVGQASQLLVEAQMLVRAGQVGMALEAMDQAEAWMEQTGVRVMEAEVWRMRGELLLIARPARSARRRRSEGNADEAEACFRRALDTARAQHARWLELRAAVSLARLWQTQGGRAKARELLAGIYGWFEEGFDTSDLQDAEELL